MPQGCVGDAAAHVQTRRVAGPRHCIAHHHSWYRAAPLLRESCDTRRRFPWSVAPNQLMIRTQRASATEIVFVAVPLEPQPLMPRQTVAPRTPQPQVSTETRREAWYCIVETLVCRAWEGSRQHTETHGQRHVRVRAGTCGLRRRWTRIRGHFRQCWLQVRPRPTLLASRRKGVSALHSATCGLGMRHGEPRQGPGRHTCPLPSPARLHRLAVASRARQRHGRCREAWVSVSDASRGACWIGLAWWPPRHRLSLAAEPAVHSAVPPCTESRGVLAPHNTLPASHAQSRCQPAAASLATCRNAQRQPGSAT